jgi:hypothetical protein
MAGNSSLQITFEVDTHGGLEDGRIGVFRRTLALWAIAFAQWLIRTRVDVSFRNGRPRW